MAHLQDVPGGNIWLTCSSTLRIMRKRRAVSTVPSLSGKENMPTLKPFTLRAKLIAAIHSIFTQAVFASLRRRAGLSSLGRRAKGGAVTFVQRFGDALNLNVHFHLLALDGVYAEDDAGFLRFHTVGSPSDKEVLRIAGHISRRVEKLILRQGLMSGASDTEQNDQPFLMELYGAACRAGSRAAI